MAESIEQTAYELREVAEILVRHQNIHEGHWMLGFEFGMGGGNMGLAPNDIRPAAFITIGRLLLIKPPANFPVDSPLVVDAAQANPKTA